MSFAPAMQAHMPVDPAYTAVNARTSLARPLPPPQPAPSSAKREWSQPVRDYVSRALMTDNALPGISHTEMTEKLKQVITEAVESQRMDTMDWYSHPLPQHLIQLERSGIVPPPLSYSQLNFNTADGTTRKRKSLSPDTVDGAPPWRARNGLADRIDAKSASRLEKKQKKVQEFRSNLGTSKYNDLEARKQRFQTGGSINSPTYRDDSPVSTGPVIGTCQNLEKSYFRLTAPPKPETVRPLAILKQTLDLLIKKWKKDHNYAYVCDQFKSMRQDLTVQHVKSEFTVRVYEAHARIALEKGDLGEYNQCQTQLRALYKLKLGGRPGEFTAYRILYYVYTCNRTGMNDMLAELTSIDKQHPAVQHALEVRSSLARGNYHKFFKLYEDPPNMGGYLMDLFVLRERLMALAAICRAYKPDVKVEYLTTELAFPNDASCAELLLSLTGEGQEELIQEREDGHRFLTAKASPSVEAARQRAFAGVDIKGQI